MELAYKNIISFVWSKDISRSVKFYTEVLGCKAVFQSQNWVELSVPGLQTGYLAINLDTTDKPCRVNEYITLGVSNLDQFAAHLKDHKVKVRGDVMEFYEEGIRMLKFYDPDENVITAAEVGK